MDFVGNALKCSDHGVRAAAARIGCEEAVLRAVIAVETGGRGFDGKQRPMALFEPHVFYRLLDNAKRREAVKAGLAYQKWGTRPYPRDSYPRIVAACRIDEERALQSTSWGLPQILGQNYRAAGFKCAVAMVSAFSEGEDAQLDAMARFIVANRLDAALVRKDWVTFAKGYNGPSYKTLGYHSKLARAYSHFCRTRSVSLPEAISPEVKNRDHATQLVKQSKRSAAVALSAAATMPMAASVASTLHVAPSAVALGGLVLIIFVVGTAILTWRASRRVDLFK
jgi:hypothetical protein